MAPQLERLTQEWDPSGEVLFLTEVPRNGRSRWGAGR